MIGGISVLLMGINK
ncbi:hypothetical protein CP8484711_1234A, partial [Chlamydia psittaci 84-8471/1]